MSRAQLLAGGAALLLLIVLLLTAWQVRCGVAAPAACGWPLMPAFCILAR